MEMIKLKRDTGFSKEMWTTFRIILFTTLLCCLVYPLTIRIIGQTITPWKANGWLIYNKNKQVIGSEIIAQAFTRSEYFWPRPSAVDFNTAGAGGSNLAPTNPELRKRAETILKKYPQAMRKNPIPVDLATTSGSGLDPHITLAAAKFQVARVSNARGISQQFLEQLLDRLSFRALNLSDMEPLINVLQVNLELDKITIGKHSPMQKKGTSANE